MAFGYRPNRMQLPVPQQAPRGPAGISQAPKPVTMQPTPLKMATPVPQGGPPGISMPKFGTPGNPAQMASQAMGNAMNTPGQSQAMKGIQKQQTEGLAALEAQKQQALGLANQQSAGFMRRADTMNAGMGRGFGGGMLGLGRQALISGQALGAKTGLHYDQQANALRDMLGERSRNQLNFETGLNTQQDNRKEDLNAAAEAGYAQAYQEKIPDADRLYKELTGGKEKRMPPEVAAEFEQWFMGEIRRTGMAPLARNFPGFAQQNSDLTQFLNGLSDLEREAYNEMTPADREKWRKTGSPF